MNLAKKHLSKAASKGRFGDTEIYKTSKSGPGKGDHWHVNKQEKSIMDMFGQRGEKLVDSIGSGTINPYTGIEEKWIPAAIAVATFAMNVVEGSAQKQLSRQQGVEQSKLQASKIKAADNQLKLAEKTADSSKRVLDLETEKTIKGVTKELSKKSDQDEQETKQIAQSSGMASSSTVNKKQIEDEKRLVDLYESTSQDTIDNYGKMIGQIEGDLEVQKAEAKQQKEQAIAMKNLADDQANQKSFFGNLGDMITG